MTLLLQLLLNAAITASQYALVAIGFGVVYRSLRFFHLAFGAVYVTASYFAIVATHFMGMSIVPSLIAGLLAAMVLGEAINRGIYLPLERKGARSGVLLIASLGIYIVIVNVISLVFGNEVRVLSQGIEPSIMLGPLVSTRLQIVQFFVGWSCVTILWLLIRTNTLVKGIWAMGETPNLVIALGLPYEFMRTLAFAISSFFAGVAAMLMTVDTGLTPYAGMSVLMTGAIAVIVGGIEVFWGWIGGAIILAFLQSLAIWQFSARWNDLITFGVLILTLIIRPQGLFSHKKRREEQ